MYNNPFLPQPVPQPFYPATQPIPQQLPRMEVVKVNGRPGAEAYNMAPNSSALLLDVSGTIVWLVTTDGAGYKTVAPYDIAPHRDAPAPDYASIETRLTRLEEIVNATANTSADKRIKPEAVAD